MGIPITAAGNRTSVFPQHELPQDRGFTQQAQIRASAVKTAALEKFTASLPGNSENSGDIPVDIIATAEDFERISLAFNRKLKFIVDHQSHDVTVKVIDPETDKVIKVLPPEELQRLHSKLKETIGFLFDERV
jgi:flagellar protein FlaG